LIKNAIRLKIKIKTRNRAPGFSLCDIACCLFVANAQFSALLAMCRPPLTTGYHWSPSTTACSPLMLPLLHVHSLLRAARCYRAPNALSIGPCPLQRLTRPHI
jgi:hypothetical protein